MNDRKSSGEEEEEGFDLKIYGIQFISMYCTQKPKSINQYSFIELNFFKKWNMAEIYKQYTDEYI